VFWWVCLLRSWEICGKIARPLFWEMGNRVILGKFLALLVIFEKILGNFCMFKKQCEFFKDFQKKWDFQTFFNFLFNICPTL